MFDALMLAARRYGLIQGIIMTARAKFDPIVLAKPRDGALIQNHLGHGGKLDRFQGLGRALCHRIEPANPVQRIAKQVQTDRPQLSRRKDVDDAATDREIAGLHHRGGLNKPHMDQKIAQTLFIHLPAHTRGKRGFAQDLARGNALHRGADRRQDHERPRDPAIGQRGQCRHTRGRHIGIRTDPIKRQTIPAGELQNHHIGGEKPQCGAHFGQTFIVARDMQNRRPRLAQFAQDQLGVEPLGRTAHRDVSLIRHAAGVKRRTRAVNHPKRPATGSDTSPTSL